MSSNSVVDIKISRYSRFAMSYRSMSQNSGVNGSVIISGKAYEDAASWPTTTKVFNMYAFDIPEKRQSIERQAAYQRADAYPELPVTFATRGKPQLTFFEGTYDVYAHDPSGKYPMVCKYPSVVTEMSGGKRTCLDPTKMTEAQKAEYAAAKKRAEDAFAEGIKTYTSNSNECTQTYQTSWSRDKSKPYNVPADATLVVGSGGLFAWKYVGRRSPKDPNMKVFTKVGASGSTDYYSCATGAKLFTLTQRISGLGSDEGQDVIDDAVAEQRKSLRMSEYALIGLFAAGLLLVWKK